MMLNQAQPAFVMRLVLLLAVVCTSLGCDNTVTRTQLTFSISASPSLQSRISNLRIGISSNTRGDQMRDFPAAELEWPVEIIVIPEGGNDSTDEVTLIATALDAQGAILARRMASSRFQPEKERPVPLALDGVAPGAGDGSVPEDVRDAGPREDSGPDEPEPTTDGGDTDPPKPDAGMDVVNCMTSSAIKCDDGNTCNGTERCAPADATANNQGCVKGSDVKTCGADSICDGKTGECSTCLVKSDGDGDTIKSVTCGGTDCDDSDKTIAPGMPELCDGKDNDCDKVVDGTAADASCTALAPTGGTASCGTGGSCVRACTNPTHVITNNMCMAPMGTCPIINPCGTGGTCVPAAAGAYTCMCNAGYRAGLGMSRCVPVGIPLQTIGFESICGGAPEVFAMGETKPLSSTQYAACGLANITSGTVTAPELIKPTTTMIAGITKEVALASVLSASGPSSLIFSFGHAVNEVSFDLLDIDNPTGIAVLTTSGMVDTPVAPAVPAAGSKQVKIMIKSATSFTRVTVLYTQLDPMDRFYVDELSFRLTGCGDKVVDMAGGEACDDGNDMQCDGCDNGCAVSAPAACMP